MILKSSDRAAVGALKHLAATPDGREALRLIDRIALAGEEIYRPGVAFETAAYRAGCQQVARILHEILDRDIDFDQIEAIEKKQEKESENAEF